MAGILEHLAGPAVELGKRFAAPIERQFYYLFYFESNIQNLKKEIENLDAARNDLQMQVDVAEGNGERILHEVKIWLRRANEIHDEISGIENEISNVQSGRFNIISRFLLSKKAKWMTEAMKEHLDHCKFDRVSLPAPPPSTLPIPLGDTYEFQSRKQIEEDIMEALRDKKFNVMGIYGMGGVGKTTMAKKIMNRVREENLFNEVVMAVISQQVDILKIQQGIADSLDLKFEAETLSARAKKLHARLTGKNGVLIVLDDIWEKLKLEDIGIPCQSGFQGCTSLLTSRNRDVLRQMDVQKVCGVETLSEPEAWWLFREKVGSWLDESSINMHSIANQVAKECKGLPIALVTVGCALKDEKRESGWTNALDQLKNLNAVDMPNVIREVYNPLKLSYELLENKNAKSLFLLCCLFPEDFDFPLNDLTMYSMGLGIFGGTGLEQARRRVLGLVDMLKNRSLLLDGDDNDKVKMHDVVRDVAIVIAGKEGLINVDQNRSMGSSSCGDCKWISVFPEKRNELSDLMRLNFPSLRLLMINCLSFGHQFEIKEDFWFSEGMKELNVLSFKFISVKSVQSLKNLRTLHLERCDSLETIYAVWEELLALEILCCRYCNNIKELPIEIGRLNRLKLLEFSHCHNLKRVAPGIISKMVELEELTMSNSFNGWESTETNGKETQKNVSLKELESLSNLTRLVIEIWDYTLAAEEIRFSSISSIVTHRIEINNQYPRGSLVNDHEKCMHMRLPRQITLGSWIYEFLSGTKVLCLEGDGSNNLAHESQAHKHLKSLTFRSCSTVKKLVDTTSSISIDWRTLGDVFPTLEFLMLQNLPNLKEIYDGSILEGSTNPFKNLKHLILQELPSLKHLWKSSPGQNLVSLINLSSIEIEGCGKLRNIFSLALIAKDALLQHEELRIHDCEMMEEIFSIKENKRDGGDQSHCQIITFPKLKELLLEELKNLTTFCKGIESIEFPLLAEMEINQCPKLTNLVSSSSCSTEGHGHDDNSVHLFCNQRVAFGSLKKLRIAGYNRNISNIWCRQIPPGFFNILEELVISYCDSIRSLFSSSIAGELVNLKELNIQGCLKMEKVNGDEEKLCERSPFSRLERFSIGCLPKLRNFCEWSCDLELSSLEIVVINVCPRMENFTMGSLSTPKLKSIIIDSQEFKDMRDLNDTINQWRISAQESTSSTKGEESDRDGGGARGQRQTKRRRIS